MTLADMAGPTEQDPAKARFALERDISDLSSLPEWALALAARAYRRGEVGEGRWRPTAGELARLARQKCDWARAEKARIDKVLAAKVDSEPRVSPEKRAELAKLVRNAASGMSV